MVWKTVPFEDSIKKVIYTTKVPKKQFLEHGRFPIVSQEADFINGYWNNEHDIFKVSSPVVIFGDHTKVIKHIDFDFVLGADGVKILSPIKELDSKFLAYFIESCEIRDLGYARHYRLLKEMAVPLPKKIEQKRIVAILDTVFADLELTRAKTEQNLKNSRELFDSYLQQVFSQKGEGCVETTLGEITGGISTGPFGSLLHKSDYIENGIPLVNPAHIVGEKVVPDPRKTISEETVLRLTAYKMKAGDIVIGRRGEMGRCALITQAEDGYLCGTGSFIIKSSDRFDGGYLVRFLRSASCVASLEKIAGGAVMPNLSNSSLSKFGIRIPSKNKQLEITKLIDQLSIEIEKIVNIYNEKLNSIDELKKSILQKAFSGELTATAE